MKRPLLVLILVAAPIPTAWAICWLPPPLIEFDPDPDPPPPTPPGPGTPGAPTPPDVPTPGPGGPGTPGGSRSPYARPRSAGPGYGEAWHLWWELNRERLLGLRGTLEGKDVVSGSGRGDHRATTRAAVREALREVAEKAKHAHLKAAALRALGRAGDDEDARRFLELLESRRQPVEVQEAAAIGLGLLPPTEDADLRSEIRSFYADLLAGGTPLRTNTRNLAIMAVALRARADPSLAMILAGRCEMEIRTAQEAAALLYACGLTQDPTLVPLLLVAAKKGEFGRGKLQDAARSYAALALGMNGDGNAVTVLTQLLGSRRLQVHTRRSAAIALGLLLRRPDVANRKRGEDALERAFRKDRDPLVQGLCAMAMGTADAPFHISELRKTVERGGRPVVRPYAALALGLAARRTGDDTLREFLVVQLGKARDIELQAALSLAVGVSRTKQGREPLLNALSRKRLKASVRGPAIQGLGLLGESDPVVEEALLKALDDSTDEVIEDAALALGFLGTRTTGRLLVEKLARTRSEKVQAHMVAALGHLGGGASVEPLLELVRDESKKHTIRESAASALGILVDDRDDDPLFEIDSATNPFALTGATRALVLVY